MSNGNGNFINWHPSIDVSLGHISLLGMVSPFGWHYLMYGDMVGNMISPSTGASMTGAGHAAGSPAANAPTVDHSLHQMGYQSPSPAAAQPSGLENISGSSNTQAYTAPDTPYLPQSQMPSGCHQMPDGSLMSSAGGPCTSGLEQSVAPDPGAALAHPSGLEGHLSTAPSAVPPAGAEHVATPYMPGSEHAAPVGYIPGTESIGAGLMPYLPQVIMAIGIGLLIYNIFRYFSKKP